MCFISGVDRNTIDLVICDVDGTLVTKEKKLTSATLAAAKRLSERGIKFALTSGRPPSGMKMLLDPLEISTPLACFNGGVFTGPDLIPLKVAALEPRAGSRAITLLAKRGADVWVYTDREWFIRDLNKPHVAREQWTVKFPPIVVDNFEAMPQPVVKIVGVSDDYEGLAKSEEEIHEAMGSSILASRSQPYYLDVTGPDANKGKVVDFFAHHFAVALPKITAIGDGNNDILMFRKVGLGIAVGNANEKVRQAAKVNVASNEADGFAEAVDRFILRRKETA